MHIIGWQQVFIKYWIMNQNYEKSKVRLFRVFRRLHGFSFLKKNVYVDNLYFESSLTI